MNDAKHSYLAQAEAIDLVAHHDVIRKTGARDSEAELVLARLRAASVTLKWLHLKKREKMEAARAKQ